MTGRPSYRFSDRPHGRSVHYSAEPQGLAPLIDWMSLYGAFRQPIRLSRVVAFARK